MGVLGNLVEHNKIAQIQTYKSDLINSSAVLFESMYSEDEGLRGLFESDKDSDKYNAAVTMQVLKNQADFMEGMKQVYGEATVMGSLGALTPKIMDVVRIFYPLEKALAC